MGILFNAFSFIFYLTDGYGTAASSRVSNGGQQGGGEEPLEVSRPQGSSYPRAVHKHPPHLRVTELGAENPLGAELASGVSLGLGLCSCLAGCVMMYATLSLWVPIFTPDPELTKLVVTCMPFVAASVVGYSTATVISGVLRGANRINVGIYVNMITLWLVRTSHSYVQS